MLTASEPQPKFGAILVETEKIGNSDRWSKRYFPIAFTDAHIRPALRQTYPAKL